MTLSIRYIPSILMLLLLLKMMAIPIMCLQYEINKDFVAANLCENRDKPQLQCMGKCHLNKNIEKNSDSSDSRQNEKSETKITLSDFLEEHQASVFPLELPCHTVLENYLNHYTHIHKSIVFRPPLFS